MPRKLAPTFEGKPCGKCSCTTRYVNGAKNCVACAQKRAALPEKRQATKEWLRNTEEGREAVRRGNRSRNLRDKEKVLARSEVRNYWRQGKLPHPTNCICFDCGIKSTEYHHEDYSKPLDVIPLCKFCHIKRHEQISKSMV